jgi:Do/DeqQ family serine protease
MTIFRSFLLLALWVVLSNSGYAALPQAMPDGKPFPSLAPMIKQVHPAVVNISTFSTQQHSYNPLLNDPFFRHFFNIPDQRRFQAQPKKRQQSAGSGVIVDAEDGIVMTNYHVIKEADEVQVSLADGRSFEAKILGVDADLDIAILEVDGKDLVDVTIADSDVLEVGDFVVAIGNPFGLGQTVTTGVVSALGRTGLGIEGYENFIQTDASINPGNSGGALVNLAGELVGINTAIIAPSGGNVGIGFAIPSNMAKASMEQILEHGEVKRGQIGIGIQDITPDLRKAFALENGQGGVLITNVVKGSPA